MLKSLSIKNYTLIDDIEITFSPGFNIFIGETGAGKSVIVGALMLALGGRANSEQVAKNKDKAVVEAVFEFPQAHPLLTKLDDFLFQAFVVQVAFELVDEIYPFLVQKYCFNTVFYVFERSFVVNQFVIANA